MSHWDVNPPWPRGQEGQPGLGPAVGNEREGREKKEPLFLSTPCLRF